MQARNRDETFGQTSAQAWSEPGRTQNPGPIYNSPHAINRINESAQRRDFLRELFFKCACKCTVIV